MKHPYWQLTPSVVARLGLVAVLALAGWVCAGRPARASTPPQVTVYLHNYSDSFDVSTMDFFEDEFSTPGSPGYGLVTYQFVTTLTVGSLDGSAALIIDESANMALSGGDSTIIHDFVSQGGWVGLFTFPRYYPENGPNQSAYSALSDIFGISAIGDPVADELQFGIPSTAVVQPLFGSTPYNVLGQEASTVDQIPFSPVTSAGTRTVLVSVSSGLPVAVANRHGMLVTAPIGDAVQGNDSNETYQEFLVDAIVWVANHALHQSYMPLLQKQP